MKGRKAQGLTAVKLLGYYLLVLAIFGGIVAFAPQEVGDSIYHLLGPLVVIFMPYQWLSQVWAFLGNFLNSFLYIVGVQLQVFPTMNYISILILFVAGLYLATSKSK